MPTQSSITLSKQEQENLQAAALQYGFSSEELARRIIADATRNLLDIPTESLDEYENPEEIRQAYRKAIQAERAGKVLTSLPRRLTRKKR